MGTIALPLSRSTSGEFLLYRLSEMMLNLLDAKTGIPALLVATQYTRQVQQQLQHRPSVDKCFYPFSRTRTALPSQSSLPRLPLYAYTLHTALPERNTFEAYRAGRLKALGDLARYRIVIATTVGRSHSISWFFCSDCCYFLARPSSPTPSITRVHYAVYHFVKRYAGSFMDRGSYHHLSNLSV
jgi:hypothetical protein